MKNSFCISVSILLFVFLTLGTASADQWNFQTILPGPYEGKYCDLALDAQNHPHISSHYDEDQNTKLKYSYYDGQNWQVSDVDNVVSNTSIAVEPSGKPHIAYYHNSSSQPIIKYATYNGTIWQISNIETLPNSSGGQVSIALNSQGYPYISYDCNPSTMRLKYAYWDGLTWHISVVDQNGNVGYNSSIAVDSQNHIHISYRNYDTLSLKYAFYNGTTWQISTIDSQPISGVGTCIALDSSGNPHIAYYQTDTGWGSPNIKYASFNGTTWQIEIIDQYFTTGQFNADSIGLAIDSANKPHISYYNSQYGDLYYATYDGSTWQKTVVDSSSAGAWNSIATDSANHPHIVYRGSGSSLKYTWYGGPNLSVNLSRFEAIAKSDTCIALNWQVENAGESQMIGFNLYRSLTSKTGKEAWIKLNNSPITGNNPYSYLDATCKNSQQYQYLLSAISSDGKEERLGVANGETGNTTRAFTITALYPNPVKSILTGHLSIPQTGNVALKLYDLSGRIVLEKRLDLSEGEQEISLDLSHLAVGVYNLQASTDGLAASKRIVVAR